MTDSKDLLTEKQFAKLEELQFKEKKTDKQEAELQKLIEKRDNAVGFVISTTCKTFLLSTFFKKKYGNRYRLRGGEGVKQMIKGIVTEKDCVALISAIDQRQYYVDKARRKNDFIIGACDIFDKPTVSEANRIIDVKTSFDIKAHFARCNKPLDKHSWWEMQGYLALFDKKEGEVSFLLASLPEETIIEQKELLRAEMCPGDETAAFLKKWTQAEAEMRFSDIPLNERIVSHLVTRDDEAIETMYDRVSECRKWLNNYAEIHATFVSKRYVPSEDDNS